MGFVRSLAPRPPSADGRDAAPPSFAALYEAHFAFAWRTLRRLGVGADNLGDAAQDVFLVVGRRLADLRSADLARSWIYGIVVRVAHEYRRKQQRSAQNAGEPDELADADARDAHAQAERAEAVELVDQLLSTLEHEKREILVLVELEQLSVPEVASLTGHNLNTVYTRLRAARAAFNEAVARHRARARNRP